MRVTLGVLRLKRERNPTWDDVVALSDLGPRELFETIPPVS
jgi:hypothetical protein